MDKFEVADGELIEPDIVVLLDASDATDVSGAVVLRFLEVVEHSACRDDAQRHILDAEPFERSSAELFEEQLIGKIGGKDPIIESVGKILFGESILEHLLALALEHQFGRSEILEQAVDIVQVAL